MKSVRSQLLVAAFAAAAGLSLRAPRAAAQSTGFARNTGIFLRAGPVLTGFGLDAMPFRLQGGRLHDPEPAFTGKQILLGREWLPGVSVGAHVDGAWFYVRIGADLYRSPDTALREYQVSSTTLGWIAAGPRLVFGDFAFQAGVRVGAMLMRIEHRTPGERDMEYSGLEALYALDLGAQWRPLWWLQIDATVGQDLLGPLTATTFGVAANVGWTHAAR